MLVGGTLAEDQIDLHRSDRRAPRRAPAAAPVRWLVVARDADARERRRLEDALTSAGVRDSFQLRYDLPFVE